MSETSEIERLSAENAVLRRHLSDDLLKRLAVENGWPHEPDNPRGNWCCEEHERAWRDGTLYGDISGDGPTHIGEYAAVLCQVDDGTTPVGHVEARWRVHAADGWHLNACDEHVARCLTLWGTNVVEHIGRSEATIDQTQAEP